MAAPVSGMQLFEQIDIFRAALVAALALIVFFAKRTLSIFDKNQSVLFEKHEKLENKHDDLRSEFNQLKGEHIATHFDRRHKEP